MGVPLIPIIRGYGLIACIRLVGVPLSRVESRYFNDDGAMERTVINVGSMMTHVQLGALSSSPELYPVYYDNKTGYLCMKY